MQNHPFRSMDSFLIRQTLGFLCILSMSTANRLVIALLGAGSQPRVLRVLEDSAVKLLVNIVKHPELFEGFLSLQSTEQSVSKAHGDEQPTIGKDRFVRFGVIVLIGDPEEFKMEGCPIWTRIENDILLQFSTFSYYLQEKVHEIINMDIGYGGFALTRYDP